MRITERIFAVVADELVMPERELLGTLVSLKERKIVRNISAIFNADRLGYQSTLVAFQVPADGVENAVSVINGHPGVSHNYLRDHVYNLWFTLAVDRETSLPATVSALAALCGARESLILKNETLFKIGFMLKMGDDEEDDIQLNAATTGETAGDRVLTTEERRAILLLQTDLPIVERPYRAVLEASGAGMSESRLAEIGEDLKRRGVMRRYAAVLKHYHAGYTANAMTAWRLPRGADQDETVRIFSGHRGISHLYLRTVHPGKWEYPLFAMVHARSEDELAAIIKGLEADSGISDYQALRSLREYKKKRVTYFSSEFEEWNKTHLPDYVDTAGI
jgi:DNA-binding Lrp family transcriptional regulator